MARPMPCCQVPSSGLVGSDMARTVVAATTQGPSELFMWRALDPAATCLVDADRETLGSAGQAGHGIDQLGDGVSVRSWSTGAVLPLGLVLAPAVASAEPPTTTPGQSVVQGCRRNGQAISGAASGPGAFGRTVRGAAPIADQNAAFFAALCSEG
jgi:hypothetical protein